jgi:hypothetical protein
MIVLGLCLTAPGLVLAIPMWGVLTSNGDPLGVGAIGGVLLAVVTVTLGGGLACTSVGWLFKRPPRVARVAAICAGAASSVLAAQFPVSGADLLSVSTAVTLVSAAIGGYFVALGTAATIESRLDEGTEAKPDAARYRRAFERVVTTLSTPHGAVILTVLPLLLGTAYAAAARRASARAIAEFESCVTSDRIDDYCGGAELIAVAADGKRFASLGLSGVPGSNVLSLWDRNTGLRAWHTYVDGAENEPRLAISRDGSHVAFTSGNASQLFTGAEPVRLQPCHEPGTAPDAWETRLAVAFSPDGRTMAVGGTLLCLVETATGAQVQMLGKPARSSPVTALTFGSDGALLYSLSSTVRVWDVGSGAQVSELSWASSDDLHLAEWERSGRQLSVSRDGSRVLVQTETRADQQLRLLDANTKREVHVTRLRVRVGGPLSLLGDGRRAVVGGEGLRVFDAETGNQERLLLAGVPVNTGVSPDGVSIVVGQVGQLRPRRPSITFFSERELE